MQNKCYIVFSLLLILCQDASPQPDTLRAPVIEAAKLALYKGQVNNVLIWISPDDETFIKEAFRKTMEVRKLGESAKQLADEYFIDKILSVQRPGHEIEIRKLNYSDLTQTTRALDKALLEESPEFLTRLLHDSVYFRIESKFAALVEKKNFKTDDLEAGRAFVKDYNALVQYIEYVTGGIHSEANIASEPSSNSKYPVKKNGLAHDYSGQPIAFSILAGLIMMIILLHFIIIYNHKRRRKKSSVSYHSLLHR